MNKYNLNTGMNETGTGIKLPSFRAVTSAILIIIFGSCLYVKMIQFINSTAAMDIVQNAYSLKLIKTAADIATSCWLASLGMAALIVLISFLWNNSDIFFGNEKG